MTLCKGSISHPVLQLDDVEQRMLRFCLHVWAHWEQMDSRSNMGPGGFFTSAMSLEPLDLTTNTL